MTRFAGACAAAALSLTSPARADKAGLDSTTVRLAAVAAGAFAAGDAKASLHAPSLGPTTAVPWNPPSPIARRRTWEQIVLMPGRLVTLPLSGLGYLGDQALIRLEEGGHFAGKAPLPKRIPDRGLLLSFAKLGDRTGLGGAAEVRMPVLSGPLRSQLSAKYSQTLKLYNNTLVTWSGQPLALQYGYDWRPQEQFYGTGHDPSRGARSDYAAQSEFVRGILSAAWNEGGDLRGSRSRASVWGGPRSVVTRTGRESGEISFEKNFPALGSSTLDRRVEHLVYGASLANDYRAGSPALNHGWRMQVSAERFDAPVRALALHSATESGVRFNRFQAEGEVGVSFMRDPRTVRLKARVMDQTVDAKSGPFLISDMATLGGRPGLLGYSPGRFHDTDLLLTMLSYTFPLARLFELDLHSEWGGVYPDVWSDAKLSTLKRSIGLSLRGRAGVGMRGSIGVDFSPETARLHFSLGNIE